MYVLYTLFIGSKNVTPLYQLNPTPLRSNVSYIQYYIMWLNLIFFGKNIYLIFIHYALTVIRHLLRNISIRDPHHTQRSNISGVEKDSGINFKAILRPFL